MFTRLHAKKAKYIKHITTSVVASAVAFSVALAVGVFSAGGAHASASNAGHTNLPPAVPSSVPSVPPMSSVTPQPSGTPQGQPGCNTNFPDVLPGSPFYSYIHCLACQGVVTGFPDGTFRPGSNVTRGQLSKMVSSSAGYTDAIPSSRQTFHDIAYGTPYWIYIERAAQHGVITGYPCSNAPGSNLPCDALGLPYFKPNDNVTRQQVAKMVAISAGFVGGNRNNSNNGSSHSSHTNLPPAVPTSPVVAYTFADVLPTNGFYPYVEALAQHGSIGGYSCGSSNPNTGAAEPCDALSRPYYRPADNMTRGQIAKVVSVTFFPTCATQP